MLPHWIIEDWRRRLAELRRLAEDGADQDRWLAPLRIRVLAFLLRRYGHGRGLSDSPGPLAASAVAPTPPPLPLREFCAVAHPTLTPPKDRGRIRAILLHLHRLNEHARQRERWRLF